MAIALPVVIASKNDESMRWCDAHNLGDNVQLKEWYEFVKRNKPVPVFAKRTASRKDVADADPNDLPILVTDATLEGFGAVLYERGHLVEAFGAKFDEPAVSSTAAETASVIAAMVRFQDRLRNTTFVLLVDNSSTEAAFRNMKARHPAVQLCVDMMQTILHRIKAKVLVARVASGDNVADAPSRGQRLVQACIDSSREQAQNAIKSLRSTSVGAQWETMAQG